jgi:hypothetical protein
MKRSLPLYTLLSVILFTALSLQSVYSQPLLVENFDYSAGTLLTDVGWTAHSGSGTNSIDVVVPGLTFTGYPLSDIGGAANADNNGEDIHKTFPVQNSGTVYAAFMVKVDGSEDGYFMHIGGDPIGSTYRGKLFMIGTASPFNFGMSVGINTATPVTGGSYTSGTTYLFVLKYEIIEGTNNDIISLFIIPGDVPATEPTVPTIGPLTDGSQSDINPASIGIRQFDLNQKVTVDGIRIATSWTDAITAEFSLEDNSPPVFASGYPAVANIDATQADLEVSMDEPGKAYYVVMPDGATAPTVAEVVAGVDYGTVTLVAHGTVDVTAPGGTYSTTITGLTDKTNYDIYVVAEDDEDTPNRQTETVMVDLYTIRPPDVLLNADFQTTGSLAPFTAVSITGDQEWYQSSGYARISGYVSSTSTNFVNLDYLISPAINLLVSENNMFSFRTMKNYDGPPLKVMISSNFSGNYTVTDVNAATWTDITSNFSFSTGTWQSVNSGEFDLSAYTGNVYIAFVYESTADASATWEVDDFRVTGYLPAGSDASLADLMVEGTTIDGFDAAKLSYEMIIEASVTDPPAVTYTTTDPTATALVTNATDLAGDAAARTTTVVVTAAEGTTTQTYSILFNPIIAVADLAALRAVDPANYDRIYQVIGEVVVSGVNDSQRHQKYVQDATAGIIIDDAGGIITTAYSVGDGITGLTGSLSEYNKLLQFLPYRDPGTASSTANTLTPQEVTVADFTASQESYESELVKIIGVTFADADGTAAFQEKKNYNISVGTDVTILRTIFLGTDLNDKIIPYKADVTGIATVYNADAQLAPRNYADLVVYSSDATLSDLKVSGTTVTGFAAGTLTYNVSLSAGTTTVPTVTATPAEAGATVNFTPATSLTGDAAARTTTVEVTSHDQSDVKTYTVVFTVATGIEDNLSGKFRIYPVPAYEEITAAGLDGATLIEIFDVTGNKVAAVRCDDETTVKIPVAHLSRGLYFMRVTTPGGFAMKRFVKE